MALEQRFLTGFFDAGQDDPGLILSEDGEVVLVNPDGSRVPIGGAIPVLASSEDDAAFPGVGDAIQFITVNPIDGYLVWFRARGTSASRVDCQELLAYVARRAGSEGNDITIRYFEGEANDVLRVEVVESLISVFLRTTPAAPTYATAQTDCPNDNSNLVFTAKEVGLPGNNVYVNYEELEGVANPATVAVLDDSEPPYQYIVVTLESEAAVAAAVDDPLNGIRWTRLSAGSAGNSAAGEGVKAQEYTAMSWGVVTPESYNVNFNDGVSTVQDLIDFVVGDPGPMNVSAELLGGADPDALLVQSPAGGNGNRYQFAGGSDPAVLATADDVKAAVAANPDTDALVTVVNAPSEDGSGIVCDDASWWLYGGSGVAATVTTDLADPDANLVFTAQQAGVDGNQLSVEYDPPVLDTAVTTAEKDGDEIIVDLAGTASVQASVVIDNPAANSDLLATRPAQWPGASGNCGGGGEPSRAGTMNSSGVANHDLQNSGGDLIYGTLVTAQEAVDFSAGSPNGEFVLTLAPGSDGTGLIANSYLEVIPTGGVDVSITATAQDVKDAIEADPETNAAVRAAYVTDGTAVVEPNQWFLAGGEDGAESETTAAEVLAIMQATPAAMELVAVFQEGDLGLIIHGCEVELDGGNDSLYQVTLGLG